MTSTIIISNYVTRLGGIPDAAFQGNYDQLTRIHMSGGNLNTIDQRSFTALHYATCSNQLEIANYLLDNGADANYQVGITWSVYVMS